MVLIYGSYGYTGALVVRAALARGLRPTLAGRSADKLATQAAETGLPTRAFPVEAPDLSGVRVLLNCAGPFSQTAGPLVDACLRAGVHYVDITGEIAVFESLAGRDAEAKAAGVGLLPGAGFDVVPTDCLAAHLAARLPGARRLALAIHSTGHASHGTLTTALSGLDQGGAARRAGQIVHEPLGARRREVDFGDGKPRKVASIPWGDVATAWHTTGIPDIVVYFTMPPSVFRILPLIPLVAPLLGSAPVRRFLQAKVDAGPPGPTDEERARSSVRIWGEVEDGAGNRAVSRLRTPDGYTLTAETAVVSAMRALEGGLPAGFQTPARAFGPDFVLGFEGCAREDVPVERAAAG